MSRMSWVVILWAVFTVVVLLVGITIKQDWQGMAIFVPATTALISVLVVALRKYSDIERNILPGD